MAQEGNGDNANRVGNPSVVEQKLQAPAKNASKKTNRQLKNASDKARKKFKQQGGQKGARARSNNRVKPHPNLVLLEANKQAVLQFADSIENKGAGEDFVVADKKKNASDLVSNSTPENAIDELTKAIAQLDEIKDNRIGIVWHQSEDLENGTKALVRDARNVTTDPEILRQEAPEKYAMQILNQTRAAIDLIDKDPTIDDNVRVNAKRELMSIAKEAMKNVEALDSSNVRGYNQRTLDVLGAAGIEEPAERLNFAKEISGLRDEHRHIVTLTTALDPNGNEHTVTEADIMLNGLTETQKKEYEKIAALSAKENLDLATEKLGIEWFDNMEPYKKALLIPVAGDIASGKKVLPSQLLHDLPGLRNAYQKVTAIKGPGQESSKVLAETLHCGAPVSKLTFASNKKQKKEQKKSKLTKAQKAKSKKKQKDERQRITNENIKQLQLFAPPGESLNLNILNSKDLGKTEDFIFDQISQAQKNAQSNESGAPKPFTSTASPLNAFRYLRGGGRDTKQFQTNLSEIARGLELSETKNVNDIIKYLQEGNAKGDKLKKAVSLGSSKTNQDKARAQLQKLAETEPDLAKALTNAVEAKALIDSKIILSPSRRISVELTAKMTAVGHSVKNPEGALYQKFAFIPKRIFNFRDFFNKYPNSVDFCKSGKDRTGYAQTKNTQLVVASELGFDINSKEGRGNFLSQVAGGHTQEMAGIQGGTVGCHSIKDKVGKLARFAFMSKEDRKNVGGILNQKSAGFNSKIKVPKGKDEGKGKVTSPEKVKGRASIVVEPGVDKKPDMQEDSVKPMSITEFLGSPLTPEKGVEAPAKPEALAGDSVCIGSSQGKEFSLEQLNPDEQNKSASSDIDPITQAVRTEILEKQQAYVLEKLQEKEPRKYQDVVNFREFLDENKEVVEKLLKDRDIQKGLRDIERNGYAYINKNFKDSFKDLEWEANEQGQKSKTITNEEGDVLCTLTEKTKEHAFKGINGAISCREIKFPNAIENNTGPMHLQMAMRDKNGRDEPGVKFSLHYDESGKLTEFSHPIPMKFMGEGNDAIGYTEIDGKIAISCVTKGNYNEMKREVAKNAGLEAGVSQEVEFAKDGVLFVEGKPVDLQDAAKAAAKPGNDLEGNQVDPGVRENSKKVMASLLERGSTLKTPQASPSVAQQVQTPGLQSKPISDPKRRR